VGPRASVTRSGPLASRAATAAAPACRVSGTLPKLLNPAAGSGVVLVKVAETATLTSPFAGSTRSIAPVRRLYAVAARADPPPTTPAATSAMAQAPSPSFENEPRALIGRVHAARRAGCAV